MKNGIKIGKIFFYLCLPKNYKNISMFKPFVIVSFY